MEIDNKLMEVEPMICELCNGNMMWDDIENFFYHDCERDNGE